jgi:hypothetical protein
MYAKILVTYMCGVYFLIFGLIITIERAVPISLQSKIIFFALAVTLFIVSFIIHFSEVKSWKPISFVFLLGNSFGFLFSFIYFVGGIAHKYNYPFSFFEIEKYVFNVPGGKYGDMNMMESMYGFVGGMLFMMSMIIIVGYGLSIRDKYKQGVAGILSFLPVLASIAAVLGIFLSVIYYPGVIWYITYTLTGSMLYIYGANLFKKKGIYLKF